MFLIGQNKSLIAGVPKKMVDYTLYQSSVVVTEESYNDVSLENLITLLTNEGLNNCPFTILLVEETFSEMYELRVGFFGSSFDFAGYYDSTRFQLFNASGNHRLRVTNPSTSNLRNYKMYVKLS